MVFHATGTGGRTMEKLADSGMLTGVIDITTTEVCDLLFGGVLPATGGPLRRDCPDRLPYVGSVGALDMINFWAPETIPERSRSAVLSRHNPNVTLMRTTAAEPADRPLDCRQAQPLRGPGAFLIPEKGVSALDIEGGAFFDPRSRRGAVRRYRIQSMATAAASGPACPIPHQRP
jgi:uncharacterized protein (UPF0261 family)